MINPMNRSTPIRMMGMASGMDTDFIIQNAMRAHQFRIDNKIRQRTLVEWRQQTHNSINAQLREFQGSLLSMTSPRSIFSANNWNTHVAQLTGANSSAVSIRTHANSTLGSFQILSVNSLARGHSFTSTGRVSHNERGFAPSTRLGDMLLNDGTGPTGPGARLRFENDSMTIDFGERNDQGVITDQNSRPVTFTREWTGGGAQGTDYQQFIFRTEDGQVLDFETNAYFDRRVAAISDGSGGYFHVTRTADGNLQRVNMDTRGGPIGFNDNIQSFTFGEGDARRTVEVTRAGEGTEANPWTYSYRVLDHNGEPVQGPGGVNISGNITPTDGNYFTIPGLGDNSLRFDINDNGQLVRVADTAEAAARIDWGRMVDSTGELQPVVINDGTNEATFHFTRNTTINDMVRAINNHQGLDVTISYDQIDDRFSIQSNNTGQDSSISITGLEMLGLGGALSTEATGSHSSVTIQTNNGTVTLDGGDSNTVNFGGVTITLNSVFDQSDGGHINVNINRNTDEVMRNITDFINQYNTIISRIEGLLRERKTPAERSYLPLTNEEKQNMTERQIEQWEEIARRGIMRNDRALESLARDLRSSFFSEIEGLGMRPSDLGLSTGNFFDGTGGQIFIDEDRLRAALEEDPDRVMQVFTQNSIGATRDQQGLAARINTAINNFTSAGGSQGNTLRGLERSIRNMNDQIDRMTVRMFAEEDRLFRQFAAMERAMSQLQSQGDWFNSMLGAMG